MEAAGFHASGTVIAIPQEEEVGTDMIKIKVRGLPPNTDFTVFLHELGDIPFGASNIYRRASHEQKRKGCCSGEYGYQAFALKTAGDPPKIRLVDADLKFVALCLPIPRILPRLRT